VGAPLELPVEERLARGLAVDGGDRLRECDRVTVESLRSRRERRRADHAEVGGVHGQCCVLAELTPEQRAQVGLGKPL
jgi:hypothetical protein